MYWLVVAVVVLDDSIDCNFGNFVIGRDLPENLIVPWTDLNYNCFDLKSWQRMAFVVVAVVVVVVVEHLMAFVQRSTSAGIEKNNIKIGIV